MQGNFDEINKPFKSPTSMDNKSNNNAAITALSSRMRSGYKKTQMSIEEIRLNKGLLKEIAERKKYEF